MVSLELEVAQLKARLQRLEAAVRRLTGGEPEVAPPPPAEPVDQAQLLAWLKAEGLVREPTPEELRLAAEWDALPEEEKQAICQELDHLPPGPMASDIIIANRR
jgi:hypothetical protein